MSTRAAVQLAHPEHFTELEALIAGMDEALAHARADEWTDLNSRFHLAIGRIAAMPLLEQMLQRVLGSGRASAGTCSRTCSCIVRTLRRRSTGNWLPG